MISHLALTAGDIIKPEDGRVELHLKTSIAALIVTFKRRTIFFSQTQTGGSVFFSQGNTGTRTCQKHLKYCSVAIDESSLEKSRSGSRKKGFLCAWSVCSLTA